LNLLQKIPVSFRVVLKGAKVLQQCSFYFQQSRAREYGNMAIILSKNEVQDFSLSIVVIED